MDKNIEKIKMNIINEGKQLSIRIPSKVVEALDINNEKDVFLFSFDKKTLHLTGELKDKKTYEELENA